MDWYTAEAIEHIQCLEVIYNPFHNTPFTYQSIVSAVSAVVVELLNGYLG